MTTEAYRPNTNEVRRKPSTEFAAELDTEDLQNKDRLLAEMQQHLAATSELLIEGTAPHTTFQENSSLIAESIVDTIVDMEQIFSIPNGKLAVGFAIKETIDDRFAFGHDAEEFRSWVALNLSYILDQVVWLQKHNKAAEIRPTIQQVVATAFYFHYAQAKYERAVKRSRAKNLRLQSAMQRKNVFQITARSAELWQVRLEQAAQIFAQKYLEMKRVSSPEEKHAALQVLMRSEHRSAGTWSSG